MRICYYEDLNVRNLEPLALCRPAFDLWCGASSLLDRQRRFFGATEMGALVRPLIAEHCAVLHPEMSVNHQEWLKQGVQVLVNARWLPKGMPASSLQTAHVGMVGDQVAYVALPPMDLSECPPSEITDYVEDCRRSLPQLEAGGHLIEYPWDLVEHNGEALEQDFLLRRGTGVDAPHVAVVGSRERLVIHPAAQVDPMVVANTTKGPVLIDRGAVVHPFSLLEGPCYIGPESWVLGAKIRGGTIGPVCRVGGEIEASILQGYANKAHEGFLGHSYLGEWVNFGAGTQISDLRNDYGQVNFIIAGQKVNSGLIKAGSYIGDHTKTGLNTLLNTGTTVGPFCHLLASSSYTPKNVPAFCSFWHGQLQDRADFRQLFTTASIVMRRRNREWTANHADFYLALYDYTSTHRRQMLWENEQRRLRRIM